MFPHLSMKATVLKKSSGLLSAENYTLTKASELEEVVGNMVEDWRLATRDLTSALKASVELSELMFIGENVAL